MTMSRRLTVLVSLIATCAGAQTPGSVRPITRAGGILAIYTEDRMRSGSTLQLVLVAWDDGYVLWSEDLLNGGPPYRNARTDPARVAGLLSDLHDDALFEIPGLTHPQFGPDSELTTILVKTKGKQLEMRSWHELVENRRGIVRKAGIVSDQRPRFQVLREEPQDYLFYRFVWAEIRGRALALVPRDGEPAEGGLIRDAGDLSWRTSSRR